MFFIPVGAPQAITFPIGFVRTRPPAPTPTPAPEAPAVPLTSKLAAGGGLAALVAAGLITGGVFGG
jgi:hypothetical protein